MFVVGCCYMDPIEGYQEDPTVGLFSSHSSALALADELRDDPDVLSYWIYPEIPQISSIGASRW